MPRSTVCLTFDFDAMSVWFGYEHVTPAMLQRGEYGARASVCRDCCRCSSATTSRPRIGERFAEHARGLGAEFAQMGEVATRAARGR